MKKKSFLRYLIVIFISILTFTSVGLSSFNVIKNKASVNVSNNLITSKDRAVCYNGTTKKKYKKIETALSDATSGQTVYVIPETNPTINDNCTIKNGVTLTLGSLTNGKSYLKDANDNYLYKDRGIVNETDETSNDNSVAKRGPHVSSNAFADSDASYCKNSVLLLNKLVIENGGTLNIGGRLGVESQGLSGATSGDYCEIVVDATKGSIENSGKIDCCGFIKTNSLSSNAVIKNYSGSVVYQPFTITDFNGGTYSASCNPKSGTKIIPFNQWVLCNIQIKQVYEFNSKLYGYYDAYNGTYFSFLSIVTVKKGHKQGEISVIGNENSIINIKSSGRLIIDIATSDYSKTTVSGCVVNKKYTVNFYGEAEIQKMIIPNPMPGLEAGQSLTNVDLSDADSSQYFFAMNHHYDANIYGTLNVITKQKVLPGCNVTVMPSGTLNINADCIFIENMNDIANSVGKNYKYTDKYNQNKNNSEIRNALINNGTVNVNGAAFGGKIHSTSSDAVLNLSSASALTVTNKEGASGVKDKLNFNITYQPDYVENARFTLIDRKAFVEDSDNEFAYVKDSLTLVSDNVQNTSVYSSHQISGTSNFGWYNQNISSTSYRVRFDYSGVDCTNSNTITQVLNTDGSSILTPLIPISSDWTFGGFYYTSSFDNSSALPKNSDGNYILNPQTACQIAKNNNSNTITIYAQWVESASSVNIVFRNYNSSGDLESIGSYVTSTGESCDVSNYETYNSSVTRNNLVVKTSDNSKEIYKVVYTFSKWVIKDENGNIVSETRTFTPEEGHNTYYVDPVYNETKYYAIYFESNPSKFGQKAITELKIDNGNNLSAQSTPYYALENSKIYVKTYSGLTWKGTAKVNINGNEIATVKGSSNTIDLSKYKDELSAATTPITIVASS